MAASAASAARDPFGILKDSIQDSMKVLMSDFDRWKEVLQTSNTANHKEFPTLQKKVEDGLNKIDATLEKGFKILGAIKKDRTRFAHIDDRELVSRETFLNEMDVIVKDTRQSLTSSRTQEKIESDRKKADEKKKQAKESKFAGLEREAQRQNQGFIDDQHSQIQLAHKEQDEVLENMSSVLKSIGVMADEMKVELEDQNQLLTQVNNQADEVNDKAQIVINRLQQLLNTNDKGKLCAIGVLLIILIALIVVVFFF